MQLKPISMNSFPMPLWSEIDLKETSLLDQSLMEIIQFQQARCPATSAPEVGQSINSSQIPQPVPEQPAPS